LLIKTRWKCIKKFQQRLYWKYCNLDVYGCCSNSSKKLFRFLSSRANIQVVRYRFRITSYHISKSPRTSSMYTCPNKAISVYQPSKSDVCRHEWKVQHKVPGETTPTKTYINSGNFDDDSFLTSHYESGTLCCLETRPLPLALGTYLILKLCTCIFV
jgi:hypothetical protein